VVGFSIYGGRGKSCVELWQALPSSH